MTKEPEIQGKRLYVFARHCFFIFIQDERLCPELEHEQNFAGIFHTQIIIVVTNYVIYKRIFWCCSSVNTRFCVDDTLTAAGRSVSKANTFRPVWVQYQHTIILCYHGRKNLAEQTTQLFEVKVTSVASDGYVFQATNVCTLQDLAFLGLPFQFRRQCHRINLYPLLWGRDELGFNKLCSKLKSIIGLEGDRPQFISQSLTQKLFQVI